VVALVIMASMRALPQSSFCSMDLVFSFVQQTINPLIVRVGILWLTILLRQFWNLHLMVKVDFAKRLYPLLVWGFVLRLL